ncbi:MAG: hypothetical protein EZS28_005690 [Streblomastix strix]|uniref:Reverse transcriptase domain-containing protein n=1 Tax=Streblomastix strix TaxID=222440 RepID=A0A5J4WUX7_9EUKA|nr:MAG: hypothetical protein EZS28_005690 [Streblomastix strix]
MGTEEQAKKYNIILEKELKENVIIPIRKELIKWYNTTLMIKIANGKQRKTLDTKTLHKEIVDFQFKMHDSNNVKQTIGLIDWGISLDLSSAFHNLIVQTESQPLRIQSNNIRNQTLINILRNSNKANNTTYKNID